MGLRQAGAAEARAVGRVRIIVGCITLLKAGLLAGVLRSLAGAGAVRLPLATWLPVLPADLLPVVLVAWVLAAGAFMAGWKTRSSGAVLLLAMSCVLLGDQQLYSNHLYLLATIVMLLGLAGPGALSIDARRSDGEATVSAWPVILLRLQVSIVYGFAALAKVTPEYLSGSILNQFVGHGSIVPFPDSARTFKVMSMLAAGSILVEVVLATAIWSRRLASPVIVAGVLFHLSIAMLMSRPADLAIFGMDMLALYIFHLPDRTTGTRSRMA